MQSTETELEVPYLWSRAWSWMLFAWMKETAMENVPSGTLSGLVSLLCYKSESHTDEKE